MKTFKQFTEDAVANNVGGGNIAGVGVGPNGEPGGKKQILKPKMFKRKKLEEAKKPQKLTRKEMFDMKNSGEWEFRPATLYSPQHTKDPVVHIDSGPLGIQPYHMKRVIKKPIKEDNDDDESYFCITQSLLIRLMEYAREDIKDDITIHKIVDNMNSMNDENHVFCAFQYDKIVKV